MGVMGVTDVLWCDTSVSIRHATTNTINDMQHDAMTLCIHMHWHETVVIACLIHNFFCIAFTSLLILQVLFDMTGLFICLFSDDTCLFILHLSFHMFHMGLFSHGFLVIWYASFHVGVFSNDICWILLEGMLRLFPYHTKARDFSKTWVWSLATPGCDVCLFPLGCDVFFSPLWGTKMDILVSRTHQPVAHETTPLSFFPSFTPFFPQGGGGVCWIRSTHEGMHMSYEGTRFNAWGIHINSWGYPLVVSISLFEKHNIFPHFWQCNCGHAREDGCYGCW